MSKCIKCGRKLTSAEIPEFYNGMCEKCWKELNCAEYPFKQGINDYQNQIDQLKQQLEESFTEEDVEGLIEDRDKTIKFLQNELTEKQNTIDEINKEFVQAVHDWKGLCAEKDKEINSLIVDYEKRISQEQELMSNMEHQLAEKDREIEEILSSKKHFKTCAENMLDVLKTINSLLPKPQENGLNYKKVADDVVVLIKEKDKEIESLKQEIDEWVGYNFVKLQYQKAIQELEKVKTWCDGIIRSNFDMTGSNKDKNLEVLSMKLDKQIKELKGEKDVKD